MLCDSYHSSLLTADVCTLAMNLPLFCVLLSRASNASELSSACSVALSGCASSFDAACDWQCDIGFPLGHLQILTFDGWVDHLLRDMVSGDCVGECVNYLKRKLRQFGGCFSTDIEGSHPDAHGLMLHHCYTFGPLIESRV